MNNDSLIGKLRAIKPSPDSPELSEHAYAQAVEDCIEIIRQCSQPEQEAGDAAERARKRGMENDVCEQLCAHKPCACAEAYASAAMGGISAPMAPSQAETIESVTPTKSNPYDDGDFGKPGTAEPQASEIPDTEVLEQSYSAAYERAEYWKGQALQHLSAIEKMQTHIDSLTIQHMHGANKPMLGEEPASLRQCAEIVKHVYRHSDDTLARRAAQRILARVGVAYVD